MEVKAFALAEAGVERAIHYARNVVKKTKYTDPLMGIKNLLGDGKGGPEDRVAPGETHRGPPPLPGA